VCGRGGVHRGVTRSRSRRTRFGFTDFPVSAVTVRFSGHNAGLLPSPRASVWRVGNEDKLLSIALALHHVVTDPDPQRTRNAAGDVSPS